MSYSDDTAEFMFTGQPGHNTPKGFTNRMTLIQTEAVVRITLETGGTMELLQGAIGASGLYHVKMVDADFVIDDKPEPRRACKTCGNSNIRFISTGDRGWAFECRRCGMDTWFTDQEMTGNSE